jgi:hypothetical protein
MIPGDRVCCACVDFDNKPNRPDPNWRKKATRVCRLLRKHKVRPLVEISQSGLAAHVWLFFKKPVPAWLVRSFWRGVLGKLDISVPEIYPRQDRLTGKGLGNLIRFPLWNLSHFVEVTAGWQRIAPLDAMSAVVLVSRNRLERVAAKLGFELAPFKPVAAPVVTDRSAQNQLPARVEALLDNDDNLGARWYGDTSGLSDPTRSAQAMSIACMLVCRYVPTTEIEAAIRFWCAENNYEKGRREDWVSRVIEHAYDFLAAELDRRGLAGARLPEGTPAMIQSAFARSVRRIAGRKATKLGQGAKR